MKRFLFLLSILTAFSAVYFVSLDVYAQYPPCLPGIPCVIDKTLNPDNTVINETNTTGSNANKVTGIGQTCDADFMNQIYARASMEAMRENIINEVVIRKPDSVLEYTCFNQFILLTSGQAGRIFSGTNRWSNARIPINGQIGGTTVTNVTLNVNQGGISRLRGLMRQLVRRSMAGYINANFWHRYLGSASDPSPPFPATSPNVLNLNGCSQLYTCDTMNRVHFLAKCNNFNSDDQFYKFSDFLVRDPTTRIRFDPRIYPLSIGGQPILCPQIENSSCPAPNPRPLEDLAYNKNPRFRYVTFDDLSQPFTDRLGVTQCLAPIPTGVKVMNRVQNQDIFGNVTTTSNNMYDEKFCPNPGCYYDKTTDQCVP